MDWLGDIKASHSQARDLRDQFFTFETETEKNQSHKIRLRPRLKSYGHKRQDQYQDLWYTVLIFETKIEMSLKIFNWFLDVRTNAESLVDLWVKQGCIRLLEA